VRAWWSARIHLETDYAIRGGRAGKPLGEYLDELLSEDELLEKSSARLMAYFDGLIEGDPTQH
jgi:hypothetical protein